MLTLVSMIAVSTPLVLGLVALSRGPSRGHPGDPASIAAQGSGLMDPARRCDRGRHLRWRWRASPSHSGDLVRTIDQWPQINETAGCPCCSVDSDAMDPKVVSRFLADYWTLVAQAQQHPVLSKERRDTMKALNTRLMRVNEILRTLAPDLALINARSLAQHAAAAPRVHRILEIFDGWLVMADHERLEGGPALPLAVLDPMVFASTAPLWAAGKYRQAVGDAATSVNHFTQNRLDRHDISDSDLMAQAFTDKPPEPGKPRLRCPGDQDSMTVQSMQRGAMFMSMGVFQAIRNPAVHMTGDWNPVTAAEHLTALSVVARWVRHWNVVIHIPPPPDYKALSIAIEQTTKS
jgi:hypothetical protein